jgi:alpha-beta hydrolase superfamily lysophospholipase
MRVFLIHGMGRTRGSLLPLARRLTEAGHTPTLYGYAVTRAPLTAIAAHFAEHVADVTAPRRGAPYAIIGHSLGNVITRLASPSLPPTFARFGMLAPPNRSPALARAMRRNPLFGVLTGDAGRQLGDHGFYASLPIPDVPTLVIAGETRVAFLPYRGAASDGVVGVHETKLDGARHEIVTAAHTFIMNHPQAVQLLLDFLRDPSSVQISE